MDALTEKNLTDMGVDIPRTLERFIDNEAFYLRMLFKFLEDPNYHLLCESIKNGDYADAFKSAHTLKGVSANMGLGVLDEKIVPLTEELRYPPYDEEHIIKMTEEMTEVYRFCEQRIKELG